MSPHWASQGQKTKSGLGAGKTNAALQSHAMLKVPGWECSLLQCARHVCRPVACRNAHGLQAWTRDHPRFQATQIYTPCTINQVHCSSDLMVSGKTARQLRFTPRVLSTKRTGARRSLLHVWPAHGHHSSNRGCPDSTPGSVGSTAPSSAVSSSAALPASHGAAAGPPSPKGAKSSSKDTVV